jgi:uncharacterized protein (UPF0548 family)
MVSLRRPTEAAIHAFLAAQAKLDFTYAAVGATSTTPPPGYVVDHTRVILGDGEDTFIAAKAALGRWQQFNFSWLEAVPSETPIQERQIVGVLARSFGLWWLNACRIVAVFNDHGKVKRFGFAYGTLPDHMESGEERFVVEWDQESGDVWYDILAFSRPRHFLARLGYPLMRRIQKKFAQESAAAMRRGILHHLPLSPED